MSSNRLMVMAGGTGGHVYPALSVARVLQKKGAEVIWLGTKKGLEARVVPENGIDIEWISVEGLRGKGILSWLLAPINLIKAIIQSITVIQRIKPDCVLGMGGFVAGPGGLAAYLLGRPLVIHEQNAVAGLTNKYLAKIATRVLTGFEKVSNLPSSAEWLGNPVREEIIHSHIYNNDLQVNILVIGGSQGAHSFNQKLPAVFAAQTSLIKVWHQSGKENSKLVLESYQSVGVEAKVSDFIEDMAAAYQWADLLICRAGAMTIAECCAARKPALLIPFPFSAGDHQERNAEAMVFVGAAKMLSNNQLDKNIMIDTVKELVADKPSLRDMGDKAQALHKPNALQSVVDVCEEYCHA